MSIVYISTNEAMPNSNKIVMTTMTVRDRMVVLNIKTVEIVVSTEEWEHISKPTICRLHQERQGQVVQVCKAASKPKACS